MKHNLLIGVLIVAIVATIAALSWPHLGDAHPKPSYPYVCADCKEEFEVAELREEGNWRIAPGGGSDSVVVCLRCNKGRAYPVSLCRQCGTRFLLRRIPGAGCPKCNPAVAKAAKAQGIDLIYHGN